jgi:peptidoglycan/xylan/chitin deacetylase (PgdA/CDA1 family)
VPYLDALGRPGTFYPTCERVLADAERWRAASERHEIANHTMTHAVAGPDTDPAEITTCHNVLLETIGVDSSTFAYTNGVVDEPYLGFSRATYVAARGTWGFPSHVAADETPDWYALPAYTVLPAEDDPDGIRLDIAVDAIETAINEGAWLSVVVHAIDEPGYATIAWADLETMMAATESADVWHATVADAATHDRVRRDVDRSRPTTSGDGSQTWSWTVIPGMSDVGIKVEPGAGRISQEGIVLPPDADGFVEIDARLGAFTWTPV